MSEPMHPNNRQRIERRVTEAAEAALAQRKYVSAIDVLVGIGWVAHSDVDRWRQGRIEYLERAVQPNLRKTSAAMRAFRDWAKDRGLKPSETAYVARTRDRRPLRFSKSGDAQIERAYRTHWVDPELSEAKRVRLAERQSRPPDLVVISPLKDWTCVKCGDAGEGLLLMEDDGPICMACADLDHLVFLRSGHAALTRRAKKASRLSAVVVHFSRPRKRYERQGILVEEAALEWAEAESLADADARAQRRKREEARRSEQDLNLQEVLAREIVRLFPGCPATRARRIARHAGARGSGRVGCSAAGRALNREAVELAVIASVRHEDTPYDGLLMAGIGRSEARERVRSEVGRVLEKWSVVQ